MTGGRAVILVPSLLALLLLCTGALRAQTPPANHATAAADLACSGADDCARACAGGHAPSCTNLGAMYTKGYGGLTKDDTRAVALFRRACDGRHALGCDDLGLMYASGRGGLAKDDPRAVALFRRACDGDEPSGCANLGRMYQDGRGGLTKDDARAVALYQGACDDGEPSGCGSLGLMYANGRGGLTIDEALVIALSERACDGGVPFGCGNLGAAFANGYGGLKQDSTRAAALFQRACDGGHAASCVDLKELLTRKGTQGAQAESPTMPGAIGRATSIMNAPLSPIPLTLTVTASVTVLIFAIALITVFAASKLGKKKYHVNSVIVPLVYLGVDSGLEVSIAMLAGVYMGANAALDRYWTRSFSSLKQAIIKRPVASSIVYTVLSLSLAFSYNNYTHRLDPRFVDGWVVLTVFYALTYVMAASNRDSRTVRQSSGDFKQEFLPSIGLASLVWQLVVLTVLIWSLWALSWWYPRIREAGGLEVVLAVLAAVAAGTHPTFRFYLPPGWESVRRSVVKRPSASLIAYTAVTMALAYVYGRYSNRLDPLSLNGWLVLIAMFLLTHAVTTAYRELKGTTSNEVVGERLAAIQRSE